MQLHIIFFQSEDIPDVDDFSFNKGGGSGGVGGSGGGGGGGDVRSFGFEKFEQGGPGSAVNSLPSIPAMSGPNPGYAYPPPVVSIYMYMYWSIVKPCGVVEGDMGGEEMWG